MSSYALSSKDGQLAAGSLLLPFQFMGESPDPELFRAQARGDLPRPPTSAPTGAKLRAVLIASEDRDVPWPTTDAAALFYLASGTLRLRDHGLEGLTVQTGDILFINADILAGGTLTWSGAAELGSGPIKLLV